MMNMLLVAVELYHKVIIYGHFCQLLISPYIGDKSILCPARYVGEVTPFFSRQFQYLPFLFQLHIDRKMCVSIGGNLIVFCDDKFQTFNDHFRCVNYRSS